MKLLSKVLFLTVLLTAVPAQAESNGPPDGLHTGQTVVPSKTVHVAAGPCPGKKAGSIAPAVDQADPQEWDSGVPVGPYEN